MTAFLKAHGTGSAPRPDHWLAAGSRLVTPGRTGFPRRPRIDAGDRLVLYASGWKCVFGVAEVVGSPALDETAPSARWPWSVAIELLVVVPLLSNAPPVEAIGVAPRSMSQQSHIRITEGQYALAVEAIGAVGS